jgi:DNA-binding transcriptional MerR regulator
MYDLTNVEALQQNEKERAEIAKIMRDAGFTLQQVNEHLEYGFSVSEPEEAPTEEEGTVDEATVRAMVNQAVTAASTDELFEKALTNIIKHVTQATGKQPGFDTKKYVSMRDRDPQELTDLITGELT